MIQPQPPVIFGLTGLGAFHTVISLIALFVGAIALIRDKEITWSNALGKVYVISTIIVCITGFGIFQHGGFGKPHILGIVTLIVFVFIYLAAKGKLGKNSPYIETVLYSLTFFFHWIPTVTEGFTRLPLDAPLASGPEDPTIQKIVGVIFILFVTGAIMQVRKMKRKLSPV
ncbi:MAG: hypothetical protein HOP08_13765 [Cyclobacteriaceae bacterium]|nr:hypothetical protein [Cyclobacteriaceae bacterium]